VTASKLHRMTLDRETDEKQPELASAQ